MGYIGQEPSVGGYELLTISGTINGSNTSFTLNKAPATANHLMVIINGVLQIWGTGYTVSGTTLTTTSAPATGSVMACLMLGSVYDVGKPTDGTVVTASLAEDAVTLAKLASGAVGKPAFHARLGSNQTVAHDTATTLAYGTEVFDTDSAYNTSTYKFTPQVAGTYLFGASFIVQNADAKFASVYISKNGIAVANHQFSSTESWGAVDYAAPHVSGPVAMNGSSDWVAATIYHNYGSDRTLVASTMEGWQFFWGFRVY